MADFDREAMLEMYIYESSQNLELLEKCIINREESSEFTINEINEIFRIMHTLKGSSGMMMFTNISSVAHAMEDLFFYLREEQPVGVDYLRLTDLILEGQDFIKEEMAKIESGSTPDGVGDDIITRIKSFLNEIKGGAETSVTTPVASASRTVSSKKMPGRSYYRALIRFEDGCEMENIRAFTLVHNLEGIVDEIRHIPENIMDADTATEAIRLNGFVMYLSTSVDYDELNSALADTIYLKYLEVTEVTYDEFSGGKKKLSTPLETQPNAIKPAEAAAVLAKHEERIAEERHVAEEKAQPQSSAKQKDTPKKGTPAQQMISVNLTKLDVLHNLMGELVIAEAMVTQNPELDGLQLEGFQKAARQLHKIINDIQDTVMSIRMVPLSTTFYKMNRIVRDMCKQLGKDVQLDIIGETTEVDKNIIEHISDPLMHIIRNSVDHGIELPDDRLAAGKPTRGTVKLEAKNAGGDVVITVIDDGQGLNKDIILDKAIRNSLLKKPIEEYTDKEIYNFIFMAGFSTKEQVTEFSGRGVGMDVAITNIAEVGGVVSVDSEPGEGSVFTIKIPLTLAIVDGMLIKMGNEKYTLPISSIIESFKAKKESVFFDPDGNEMIMVRGESYNIVRMYEFFDAETSVTELEDGILIMLEYNGKAICLFTDQLIGEQQVVTKSLPRYIKPIRGISGCTLLGNGDISLIVDIAGFFEN